MNWLKRFFGGTSTNRPAITPAQVIAGVPLLANLLAVYGIFTPNAAQSSALKDLIFWSIGLFGVDAVIRAARNIGDGLTNKKIETIHTTTTPPTST